MRRLMACAGGWGTKGTGLGLLQVVEMDDEATSLSASTSGGTNDNIQHKGAGEISFECYVPSKTTSGEDHSHLVSVYIPYEEMYVRQPPKDEKEEEELCPSFPEKKQAEKRRKVSSTVATSTSTTSTASATAAEDNKPKLKSTAQLFQECLSQIKHQGIPSTACQSCHTNPSNIITLPPEKQFTLLTIIRLARSFHASSMRILAIEHRLRALICMLSCHPSPESVSAYFAAQPELCGELVDLVRPTVSGGNISSASVAVGGGGENNILALADSPQVPYNIRTLAIETLTALVARRDTAGTVTNVSRQVNVMSELGVGKGQYMGLLPALIRYSLAALNSFLLHAATSKGGRSEEVPVNRGRDIGLELGLAFLKATKPPPLAQKDREERALEFIDSVLTLTSAVISVPTGTAALTDCGIIPALVSTIALDSQTAQMNAVNESSPFLSENVNEESYSDCLLKFISAQAIQILEGAIVTHNSALAAFHELKGVDILVQRLSVEVEKVNQVKTAEGDVVMGDDSQHSHRELRAAKRVLLFSAVNCLTVVFHQQEAGGNNPNTPSGGGQLRKPELHNVVLDILDNVDSYGGVLAALVATLMSDVMNADPQVVHFVHKSGLAKSFLALLLGKDGESNSILGDEVEEWGEIAMEPSAELIMAIPNVILALALTQDGSKAVAEANPFPALLSVFCSPKYAMPNSRCLLNEMAAVVGTGMDEIMRHNPSLRSVVLKAIVQVMNRIVYIGKTLTMIEEHHGDAVTDAFGDTDLETVRTYLMQYGHNITQLLEQIMHNEDHVPHFVDAGGFDSLLELARWSITPAGKQLVAHVTCLSSPSFGSITHSTTSGSVSVIVRTVATHYDPHKLIKKVTAAIDVQLESVRQSIGSLRDGSATGTAVVAEGKEALSCNDLLQCIPTVPIYSLEESSENEHLLDTLASFYRSIISIDWLAQNLATTIRAACARMNEMGSALGRSEREWKKELASKSFEKIVEQLSVLHRSALWEACRVRTEPGFDERDLVRTQASNEPLVYRIRIVCQEGAIVRNGIDIDSCDNIGNVEMGEIVEAYDRCINSSGVLRYKTNRGWVSEMTRGHGRENIAEIINVRPGAAPPSTFVTSEAQKSLKRIECGVPDLSIISASVLARLHSSHTELFSSLEKVVVSGVRALPIRERTLSFQQTGVPPHVVASAKILSANLKQDFDLVLSESGEGGDESSKLPRDAAKCMYLGNTLNLFHACLYSEKRADRRGNMNIPLLLNQLVSDGWKDGVFPPENDTTDEVVNPSSSHEAAFLTAIRFVLKHSLRDMGIFAVREKAFREEQQVGSDDTATSNKHPYHQRVSKAVASSFPPTLSLLQRLISRPILLESQVSNVLTKIKSQDFDSLITATTKPAKGTADKSTPVFNSVQFTRALHIKLAKISFEVLSDDRLCSAPAHIVHPWISYIVSVIDSLEEAGKVASLPTHPVSILRDSSSFGRARGEREIANVRERLAENSLSLNMLLGNRPGINAREGNAEPFQPSEESITMLTEMGFGREHAIESLETVETNRVDVAMEYALSHPPSSPSTFERRRAAREERRVQRERDLAAAAAANPHPLAGGGGDAAEGDSSSNNEAANPSASANAEPTAETKAPYGDDDGGDSKPPSLTEEELKAKREKEFEEKDAAKAKQYLESVRESLPRISLNIIEGGSAAEKCRDEMESVGTLDDGSGDGDVNAEGIDVVVATFMLDLCSRFPDDSTKISSELLRRLKANLRVKSPSHCQVKIGCETNFAALAHASVIFFRALPKSRPTVLRHGIVNSLLHCVRNVTLTSALRGGNDSAAEMVWPRWLSPVLLFLEVMAQPTSISLEECEEDGESGAAKPNGKKGEYAKVLAEHKKQITALAKTTKQVFTALNKEVGAPSTKKKKAKETEATKSNEKPDDDVAPNEKSEETSSSQMQKATPQPPVIPTIPTFLPLILSETAEACMLLSLQLLGLRSSKKLLSKDQLDRVVPPPSE